MLEKSILNEKPNPKNPLGLDKLSPIVYILLMDRSPESRSKYIYGDSAPFDLSRRTTSRRNILKRLAVVGTIGAAGSAGGKVIVDYLLQTEDRGYTSLHGQPRNPEQLKDPYFVPKEVVFNPRFDGRTIFRKSPTQDDGSLIPEDKLRKLGMDSRKPFRVIDVYGVVYGTNRPEGNIEVRDPKTGKIIGNYGGWKELVSLKPDGTFDKRLGIFVPDIYSNSVPTPQPKK